MPEKVKFLFDTSFETVGSPAAPKPAEPAAPSFSEAELAAAREAALAEGREAGAAAARAGIEAEASRALARIAEQLGGLLQAQAASEERIRREAAALAYVIGSKLAPALMLRFPLVEVEALLKRCLSELHEEPRLVVRASAAVVEGLKTRLEGLAAATGFAGHVVLLPDDAMSGADCRVEWADGGAERDTAALMGRIEAAVQRFLQPSPS